MKRAIQIWNDLSTWHFVLLIALIIGYTQGSLNALLWLCFCYAIFVFGWIARNL